MEIEVGGHFDGALGDQAYDFAADDGDAVTLGFALYHFEDAMKWSLFEIGHVDGDLRELSGF